MPRLFSKTKFRLDDGSAPRHELIAWGDLVKPDQQISLTMLKSALDAGYAGGFVCIDRNQGTVEIYRDAIGIEAAYYEIDGNSVTVSRLPFLSKSPSLNENYIRSVLANNFSDYTITSDSNVHIVPPGSLVRIQNGRVQTEHWYRPNMKVQNRSHADAKAELRSILKSLLGDHINLYRSGLAWGAGLDSSIIAFEAANSGVSLPHYTFSGTLEGCEIDESILLWRSKLGKLNMLHLEQVEGEMLWDPQEEPFQLYTPNFAMMRPVMRSMQTHGLTAVLTGNGSDDIFSFPAPSLKARILPKPIYRLGQRLKSQTSRSEFIPDDLWREEQFKKTELIQKREPSGLHWYQSRLYSRILCGGNYQFALRLAQDAAARFGLTHRSFFLHKKVFEFALSLPEELWTSTGLGKDLLRETYRGLLPNGLTLKRSTQDYGPLTIAMLRQQQSKLMQVIKDGVTISRFGLDSARMSAIINSDLDSTQAFEFFKVVYCEQIIRQVRLTYEQNKKTDKNIPETQT